MDTQDRKPSHPPRSPQKGSEAALPRKALRRTTPPQESRSSAALESLSTTTLEDENTDDAPTIIFQATTDLAQPLPIRDDTPLFLAPNGTVRRQPGPEYPPAAYQQFTLADLSRGPISSVVWHRDPQKKWSEGARSEVIAQSIHPTSDTPLTDKRYCQVTMDRVGAIQLQIVIISSPMDEAFFFLENQNDDLKRESLETSPKYSSASIWLHAELR